MFNDTANPQKSKLVLQAYPQNKEYLSLGLVCGPTSC